MSSSSSSAVADAPAPPREWSRFMGEIFASRKPPLLGSVHPDLIEQAAREKLKDSPNAFHFVFGSAGIGQTYDANRGDLAKWQVIPRMLRDTTRRTIETTIFGAKLPSPLILAPIGVQGILHADGEFASARAAEALGIPYVLSSAASRSIESISRENGTGRRWLQLYWPTQEDITLSILGRAKAAGCSALVVTLDTMTIGWRPADVDTAYSPFLHGLGFQQGLSDPVFMASRGLAPHTDADTHTFPYEPAALDALYVQGDPKTRKLVELSMAWTAALGNGTFRAWEDLAFLRKHWDGPLVLKGILCPEDAELAIEHGADGIIVSNHGGRQVDGAISAVSALERICQSPKVRAAQASGAFTVLFDSGIRTGTDIFRALALGAQGVLIGRLYAYALAIAGKEGVEAVVKSILADFELTLGLAGYKSIDEIHGRAAEIMHKAA